ncbi:LLM class flavin-dependent oxidoreductase [Curtobacterium flaccumfaciens]|nr:LLM class flavin-dependent oxidoreductase [Curtobacterium flaccumfaciens]
MTTAPFAIAIELDGDGAHPAAWRAVDHAPADLLSGERIAATVRAAERAGFTAVTFDDAAVPPGSGPTGRLDAVQRAAFAAPLTAAIGLVPVVPAVHAEPFHVSTQLATVDLAAAGRAGWIAATDPDPRSAAVYGRPAVDAVEAVATVADAIEVVRQLLGQLGGRRRDQGHHDLAVHRPRPPAPGDGRVAAVLGRRAEHHPASAAGTAARVRAARGRAAGRDGRGTGHIERSGHPPGRDRGRATRVWLELEVALDRAGVPAARRIAGLDAHEPWVPGAVGRYVGDAAGLVDLLTDLVGQVDGVRLHPAVLDDDLDEIGRAVLPALREAGLFRSPRPGDQLREVLGLPVAVNRHTAARTATLEEVSA